MKRKLNKTERELTKKGVERNQTEIIVKSESLEMQEAARIHSVQARVYEDKLRPYNRKVEDKNFKVKIELLKSDIKIAQDTVETLKDQLKNGVEVKEKTSMVGVN